MAVPYSGGVIPVKLQLLFVASAPLQLAFAAVHFALLWLSPGNLLLRDALPVAYLAVTYAQWLLVSFYLSLRTGKYRIPIVMHLPHLLSFLPLARHILLAADGQAPDTPSLAVAWIHCVVTHCFSLPAAWLWQVRGHFGPASGLRQNLLPILLLILAQLTILALYAGLDFGFARSPLPLGLGLLQLLLYAGVTLALLRGKTRPLLPALAAVAFALVNGALLFDRAGSRFGVELALAAGGATQLFALYVFARSAA